MNNSNNKNVTKHIKRINIKECSNSSAGQKTIDNLETKRLNILEIEMNDERLFHPGLQRRRWQTHTKPPELGNFQLDGLTTSTPTTRSPNSSNSCSKRMTTSCNTGLKRRTIYGGTLASTVSVFLIKCLILATAYDDKFVNKL